MSATIQVFCCPVEYLIVLNKRSKKSTVTYRLSLIANGQWWDGSVYFSTSTPRACCGVGFDA